MVPTTSDGKTVGHIMVPKAIACEDCGRIATVRGYGRVEYEWPKTSNTGQVAAIPTINSIRLTVDCPVCGVKMQDFRLQSLEAEIDDSRVTPKPLPLSFRRPRRAK
jgi:hypothetical protein